jgi:hypothetical protein
MIKRQVLRLAMIHPIHAKYHLLDVALPEALSTLNFNARRSAGYFEEVEL